MILILETSKPSNEICKFLCLVPSVSLGAFRIMVDNSQHHGWKEDELFFTLELASGLDNNKKYFTTGHQFSFWLNGNDVNDKSAKFN